MERDVIEELVKQLRQVQDDFYKTFGVTDIITNSKIFEIIIADRLGHELIPGHSGSRDAKDATGEYEYKHYKESSSNHTWTFNDFTLTTIAKLAKIKSVIFAHIQDVGETFPKFDWYYEVPGSVISEYLACATGKITNNRKMINVSSGQIEMQMKFARESVNSSSAGRYTTWIIKIIEVALEIEKVVGTKGILTSNKFWEVLVAQKLGHKVMSEQAKHDAENLNGAKFEYKVAKNSMWSFQDISAEVLSKYLTDDGIVMATVDKEALEVKRIFIADPKKVVALLRKRLRVKALRYKVKGKEIRRKQISLSSRSLKILKAVQVFP